MNKKIRENKELPREHPVLIVIRVVLGLVFIFSSVMKGIDPMGTAYRVEDYLGAYNMYWLDDYNLFISFFVIGIEFLIGVALLFKLKPRLASLGVFLIMIFFTVITYIDAKENLVPDCGCFGDAITITPWQTFYKNIILIILAAIVFFARRSLYARMKGWLQWVLLIFFALAYGWFMSYNFNHLPIIDFRDWKEGNDMKSVGDDKSVTYLIYRNKETGEEKEYISPDYPWRDSVWMSRWEFVDQRTEVIEALRKHNLIIEDFKGNNYTKAIIENSSYTFLLITPDIEKANGKAMITANELMESTANHDVNFVMITASVPETLAKYREVYKLTYAIFLADGTELKAMIRSNPGLILMKDGVVIEKWHYNDFPSSWREANRDINQ
ncbi:MAG: DoxX family protein [bacterium]|jgi:uncharacterized membrane protein YphA (DoxX/SURF4 family)